MLVLQQATKMTRDPATRFAALCHDLGKGTTPKDELPKHHGHEKRSVDLLKEWCKQYPVPNSFKDLALAVAENHGLVHAAFEMRPNTLLKLLEKLRAFHNSDNLDKFLIACLADSRGRPGWEEKPYPQLGYIEQAYKAAAGVEPHFLIEQGFTGALLGQRIREAKIAAIQLIKDQHVKGNGL
jgi:tRNA nucleotidyltransferase (CCA-adding enzyme)